jgi:hypothetical protein
MSTLFSSDSIPVMVVILTLHAHHFPGRLKPFNVLRLQCRKGPFNSVVEWTFGLLRRAIMPFLPARVFSSQENLDVELQRRHRISQLELLEYGRV